MQLETVGFTTDYTVATWVGNFNGEPMHQVSGVSGAAPLWHRIMVHLHEQQEPDAFLPPVGLVKRPVCALSGLRPTPACPSVVQEYFYPEDLAAYERQLDTFYQPIKDQTVPYRLSLPQEYDGWLAQQPELTLAPDELKILSPQNEDYFIINPLEGAQVNGIEQRLAFKIARPSSQPVEWWLNGRKLETQLSTSFFWPLQPGNWTLEVRSGKMVDRVNFQVQLAENKPPRRGFSVANP
ncbi:MAG: hypothetical protein F6K19_38215 [Cyanothece sp. SIO1E1]|nr:hypothetical protein [Cyanothece sp. SIO1E1]